MLYLRFKRTKSIHVHARSPRRRQRFLASRPARSHTALDGQSDSTRAGEGLPGTRPRRTCPGTAMLGKSRVNFFFFTLQSRSITVALHAGYTRSWFLQVGVRFGAQHSRAEPLLHGGCSCRKQTRKLRFPTGSYPPNFLSEPLDVLDKSRRWTFSGRSQPLWLLPARLECVRLG